MNERIEFYLKKIKENEDNVKMNHEKLRIYEGDLLPFVREVMRKTLSENYFRQIEHRIIPINVLTRIVDKLSKVYISPPVRKDETYQEFIDQIITELDIDLIMSNADEFSHLFKSYALEPYIDEGMPGIRVLPADRFMVIGEDKKNPMKVTTFIKYMGKINELDSLYYAYTDMEFIPFTSKGEIYVSALDGNDGVNPYGVIPFVYGNRSKLSLVPTQDTDITQLTLMIPILLSDLAGAIMFSCFSVIYGIDLKIEKLEKSPNSFWNFKTDSKNDNAKPEIGTIKSDVDIDKVMSFIKQTFAFWLETKGVRIGSLNNVDAGNVSGIAKIIDEMDVYEIKKQQINYFKKEEKNLWNLLAVMNNYWVKSEPDYDGKIVGEDFNPTVVFDEPRPEIPRATEFATVNAEYLGGYMESDDAIAILYPDLDENEIEERAAYLDKVNNRNTEDNGTSQDDNNNTEPVESENSAIDS